MTNKFPRSEDGWKEKLTSEQYEVLRQKGTERAFTGKHLDNHEDGTYHCMACGAKLFESDAKFDSGSGWPSFDKAIEGAVEVREDNSHGMNRVEAACINCKSHLGHVFKDGPTETGNRFCINSVCLEHAPLE